MDNKEKKPEVGFSDFMPGSYQVMCKQCDWGSATVEANSINDAISKGLRQHDAYYSNGGENCGGDSLTIHCPDGSVVET